MLCLYDPVGGLSGTLVPNTVYVFDQNYNGGSGPSVSSGTNVSCTNPVTNVNTSVTVCGIDETIYLMNNIPLDFSNNGTLDLYPPGFGGSCTGSGNPLCGITIDAPTDGGGGNATYSCSSGMGNNGNTPARSILTLEAAPQTLRESSTRRTCSSSCRTRARLQRLTTIW